MSLSIGIIERKFRRVSPIVERTSFFIRFNFENIRINESLQYYINKDR